MVGMSEIGFGFELFSYPWLISPVSLSGLEPLLLTARDFLDALSHGQMLRHRAAEFVNGLADFAATSL
jgi:hypothetical protein